MTSDEAAEDQGWGKRRRLPLPKKTLDIELPTEEEKAAGKAGVAAARAAIALARMDLLTGRDVTDDEHEDDTVVDA